MSLDVTALRQHIETELADEALARLLEAAYEAIDEAVGAAADVSEYFRVHGDLLLLSRRAESIASVTENDTALETDDYELRPSGLTLRRLDTGTNPRRHWHRRIDVTYRAYNDESERDRVAVELVKLDLAYSPGLVSQSIGAWSETYTTGTGSSLDYAAERATILASLGGTQILAV
jgi:hypothetical protein